MFLTFYKISLKSEQPFKSCCVSNRQTNLVGLFSNVSNLITWPLYHYICRSNLQKLLAFDQIMCLLFIWSTFLYFKLHSISIEQCLFKTAAWIKFKNNKFYYYSLLTCPPCFPRPYCLPSINPASQSVRMILSSSLVPLMYLIQASASARV